MSQANTKYRFFRCQNFLNGSNRVITRLRIARSIGQKYTIRIARQHFSSRRLRREHRQTTTTLRQHTQNIGFHAKIVHRYVIWRFRLPETFAQSPFAFVPFVGLGAGNFFCQIFAIHAAKFGNQLVGVF